MSSLKSSPALLDAIRSLHDAGDLIRMFHDKLADQQPSFLDIRRRQFLNLAIEHNHQNLVSLLLADARFQLNTRPHLLTPTPLFVAVRSRNVTLIKQILDAGALVYHESNELKYVRRDVQWNIPPYVQTLIDYATSLDESAEILQILVSVGCKQNTKGSVPSSVSGYARNGTAATCSSQPLHIIIHYAFQRYSNDESFALLPMIQLALNSGASLDEVDTRSKTTPFRYLLEMVRSFAILVKSSEDEKMATAISEARAAIEETVQMFLQSEAPISSKVIHFSTNRIDEAFVEVLYSIWFSLSNINTHPSQLNLLAVIFEQFITYSWNPMWKASICRFHILRRILHIVRDAVQPSDVLMDYLGDMLRCSLSYGAKIFEIHDNMKILKENFGCLARISSLPGQSTKLMMLVLNELSRSQLVLLQSELLYSVYLSEHQTDKRNALEWIQRELGRSSLQHLARRAIRRAMRSRSGQDYRSLGLPKCVEEYVAYCYE